MGNSIWYIHPYGGAPSMGRLCRPYYLAREFNKKGNDTYVVSSSYHHLVVDESIFAGAKTGDVKTIDNVKYIAVKTIRYKGNSILRLLNMVFFGFNLLWLLRIGSKKIAKPNVIIASSPHLFHVVSAFLLAKRFKAKFIVEVRDIWPQSLVDISGFSKKHPIVWLLKRLELFAYKKADSIVSVLPKFSNYLKEQKINKDFLYIPNGVLSYDRDMSHISSSIYDKLIKLKKENKFILFYGGAMGPPNALEPLIEGMRLLRTSDNDDIIAVLVGSGSSKKDIEKTIIDHDLTNIYLYDAVKQDEFRKVLSVCDVAYTSRHNIPVYDYGVSPNKIFEYMYAGIPILQSATLDYDLIKEAKCGVTVPAEDPNSLVQDLVKLAKSDKQELSVMGQNGQEFLKRNHDFAKLAKKYCGIM